MRFNDNRLRRENRAARTADLNQLRCLARSDGDEPGRHRRQAVRAERQRVVALRARDREAAERRRAVGNRRRSLIRQRARTRGDRCRDLHARTRDRITRYILNLHNGLLVQREPATG